MTERDRSDSAQRRVGKVVSIIPRDSDGFPIPQEPKPMTVTINGRVISVRDLKAVTE